MIAPQTLLQNRYLVIRQIGQGGMGAVYVATDQRFGSTVALKETFFTDPSLRRAFEREARLLNRLRHPALPRVSDHFIEEEGQFLVMEFITGEDLWEMLNTQGGPFPFKEVLDWADQLLDALDYLHTQDPPVIHRDIKPQNLKLTKRGQIVLLDFGLAKGTPLQVSQASATGSIFGYSRNYAPIEQIQGTGTDPRSDLYSLGATLYHLMTAVTPPDALTRASAVLNGQPDPLRPANEMNSQVPPGAAQVLMRVMSQNAGLRPQTAVLMRAALREAANQTLPTGLITNAQHSAANTLFEQDTQLKDTHQASALPMAGAYTENIGALVPHDDATVADDAFATSAGMPPLTTSKEDAGSVVTKVRPASRRWMAGRALGITAAGLILLLVGAVVYSLMRRATPQVSPDNNAPEANSAPPATQPADQTNQTVESQATQPTEPTAVPKRVGSDKNEKRTGSSTASGAKSIPDPPNPPRNDVPTQVGPAPNPNTPGPRNQDPYWDQARIDAERRRAVRRALEEQRRAERERRRAEQLRRRTRPGYP